MLIKSFERVPFSLPQLVQAMNLKPGNLDFPRQLAGFLDFAKRPSQQNGRRRWGTVGNISGINAPTQSVVSFAVLRLPQSLDLVL